MSPVAGMARSLNLAMEDQEKDNWCWAAVSVSVRKFYGMAGPRSQCGQAEGQFHRPCCADPDSCDQRWILDPNIFTRSAGTFPFVTVQQQIDAGRLVTARITWAEGGTHYVCIDGYNIAGPEPLVSVKDPFYGPSTIPYNRLVAGYLDRGSWTESYRS
ncbi:MAG: hypothetical protein AABO58_17025 [Acidobacteriota bacterium]